jgi:hypothetical protein
VPKGNGRIYTVPIIGTDVSGNQAQEKVEIRVPHDQGKEWQPGGNQGRRFGFRKKARNIKAQEPRLNLTSLLTADSEEAISSPDPCKAG